MDNYLKNRKLNPIILLFQIQRMDYHIRTKSLVDKAFLLVDGHEPIEMISMEDSEMTTQDFMIFNCKIPDTLFVPTSSKLNASISMLSYGAGGGVAEYNLEDLISKPLKSMSHLEKMHDSPIILNLPHATSYAIVEFPKDLIDLFSLPKYVHCVKFDTESLRKKYKLSDNDLLNRGIDVTKATWTCMTTFLIPEWALSRIVDLVSIVNESRSTKVHCFSFTGMQNMVINKES